MEILFKNGAFKIETGVITAFLSLAGVIIGAILNMICENIKRKLTKKNYVSKVRFDKEFEIYYKLSNEKMLTIQASFKMFYLLEEKINSHTVEMDDAIKELIEEFNKVREIYNKSNLSFRVNRPFIAKEISDEVAIFYAKVKEQLGNLGKYIDNPTNIDADGVFNIAEVKKEWFNLITISQNNLSKQCDNITDSVRKHLENLEAKG